VDVLPIAEIVFEGLDEPQIVGYDAKWTPSSQAYIGTPRRFGVEREDKPLAAELSKLALACWTLFGLSGYARVDFRVDAQGHAFILEVNVNPCLSPDAGFAAAAAEAGLSYPDLIGRIVAVSLGGLKATA
jgi:D-alanine-D-alanine ligase